MKKVLIFMLAILLALSLAACLIPPDENAGPAAKDSGVPDNSSDQTKTDIIPISTYVLDPNKTDQENLVNGNSTFAFDLYQILVTDPENQGQNLFFSPYSISLALAMSYAGARNETEHQMTQTLNFILPQDRLHSAFNSLNAELRGRSSGTKDAGGKDFRLKMANAIWGQEGYGFLPDFTDLLTTKYDAGMKTVDFENAPEDSRITINNWVSDQTEDRIKDLIHSSDINPGIRLVLTNAIYFNAAWLNPFEENGTHDGQFYLSNGKEVIVPMMRMESPLSYAGEDNYQAIELPYYGDEMSMIIIVPKVVSIETFEKSLNSKQLNEIVINLQHRLVALTMPKFELNSEYKLNEILSDMGMPLAFTPMPPEKLGTCSNEWADFSGIINKCGLFISFILHKAFVTVDEAGTEAAAATAVGFGIPTSAGDPFLHVNVDHPFIFLIRDIKTGTILFLGRVMDPS